MKRDLNPSRNLINIRALLLHIEYATKDGLVAHIYQGAIEPSDKTLYKLDSLVLHAHAQMLVDAGLAIGEASEIIRDGQKTNTWAIERLTHKGHEMVAVLRDEKTFNRALKLCEKHGFPSLDLLFDLLRQDIEPQIRSAWQNSKP